MKRTTPVLSFLFAILWALVSPAAAAVHVRVTLLEPTNTPYQVQVAIRPRYTTNIVFVAGQTRSAVAGGRYSVPGVAALASLAKSVAPIAAGQSTAWLELTEQ